MYNDKFDKMSEKDKHVYEWRLSSNLTLLYSSYPSVTELDKDYREFIGMEPEDRYTSDDESLRTFGKENKERYEEMLHDLYSVPEPEYDEFKQSYFPPNKITIDPLDRLFLCREMAFDKDYFDKIDPNNYLKYIQEEASEFDLSHDKEELKKEIMFSLEQSNMYDDVGLVYPMLMLENMSNEDGDIVPEDDDHKKWLIGYKKLITIGDKSTYNSLFDWWKKTLMSVYRQYTDARDDEENKDEEKITKYREMLIKLGWIPGIDPNPEIIDKASLNTKNKLEELLNRCTIIDTTSTEIGDANNRVNVDQYMYFMFVKLNGKYSNIICANNKEFNNSIEIGYNFSSNSAFAIPVAQRHNLYGLEDRSCEVYTIYNPNRDKDLDFSSIRIANDTSDFDTPFDPLDGKTLDTAGTVKLFIFHFLNAYGFISSNRILLYKIHDGTVKDYLTDYAKSKLEAISFVLNKSIKYRGLSEASTTNEFPVEFDKEGNLIINKGKKLDIDGEYSRTHLALKMYDENKNVNGMKYCLCKLWYINIILEDKIHNSKSTPEEKKTATKQRAKVMNDIKTYTAVVLKLEPGFEILKTYKNSPFNNDKVTIKSSTLFYLFDTIKNLLTFKDVKKFFK